MGLLADSDDDEEPRLGKRGVSLAYEYEFEDEGAQGKKNNSAEKV